MIEQGLKPIIDQAREAEHFMAAVVDSSDDAIITKDLNGIITSWNPGAERLFGYSAEEAIGRYVTMLIPPEREDEEPNILGRLRRGERIDHYETVRRRKDGALLDISLTVSPVRDGSGRIIGASKIARDITARKRIERQLAAMQEELTAANTELESRVAERTASLERAVAQMEEFSYSVSHDLRSPVRAMKGYAEALIEDHAGTLDEEGRTLVERIIRSGTRMENLIQDLLTYSRLARSELKLHPVAVDRLVADIVQQYDALQSPKADVVIRQPMARVLAHEPSLLQALSNLLVNSIKFVEQGKRPRVEVWTESRNAHVRLWVQDNGIGVRPEYQSRLFRMFERVHKQSCYEGTGIGLAIVRKAAERMGGRVGMESDGVSGSRFWIELSAAP